MASHQPLAGALVRIVRWQRFCLFVKAAIGCFSDKPYTNDMADRHDAGRDCKDAENRCRSLRWPAPGLSASQMQGCILAFTSPTPCRLSAICFLRKLPRGCAPGNWQSCSESPASQSTTGSSGDACRSPFGSARKSVSTTRLPSARPFVALPKGVPHEQHLPAQARFDRRRPGEGRHRTVAYP